jgi:type I restriction enzyme S subunit
VLEEGDLLLEKSGGGELQPVGCVVIYDDPQPAVCSNFIARMQIAAGMNSSFWRYVHAAAYAVRLTTGSINQTSGIQNLDQDRYFNERAAFPPLPEQSTIAAFIDCETAKIDALITEQHRLIELLKEKRQAFIFHAVTKGLNANAPMKGSGIEWLGEVPEHWEVRRVKDVAKLESGHTPSKQVPDYWENCEIPWVSLNDSKQLAVVDYITETAV